jgi:hypothetical protein
MHALEELEVWCFDMDCAEATLDGLVIRVPSLWKLTAISSLLEPKEQPMFLRKLKYVVCKIMQGPLTFYSYESP